MSTKDANKQKDNQRQSRKNYKQRTNNNHEALYGFNEKFSSRFCVLFNHQQVSQRWKCSRQRRYLHVKAKVFAIRGGEAITTQKEHVAPNTQKEH